MAEAIDFFLIQNMLNRYSDAVDSGDCDAFVLTEMVEIRDAIRYHASPAYLHRWAARAAKARAQVRGRLVVADQAEELDAAAERGDVVRDVGGSSQAVLLLLEADHRDRRFGRNALDAADDEVIEHHVADDQDRASGRRIDQRRQVSRRGGHRQQARWPSWPSAPPRKGA